MVGQALILSASLMTGQVVESRTGIFQKSSRDCNCQSAPAGPVQPTAKSQPPLLNRGPMFGNSNRPILHKLGSLFGKKDQVDAGQEIYPAYHQRMPSSSTSAEPPILDPAVKPAVAEPQKIKPISYQAPSPAAKIANPILPQFADRIGHEEDFSWVTGQFEIENGVPVIYYAAAETVDRHNGRLVLHIQGGLKGLQAGDLVSVHGSLVNQSSNPIYRATRIDVIERGR